ncbi:MAG: conjugative transposon protein TraM [Amoebophilaceae bacterium]|nr:conjugative transposon protein TraM [Amoebophilaceae bacterium]
MQTNKVYIIFGVIAAFLAGVKLFLGGGVSNKNHSVGMEIPNFKEEKKQVRKRNLLKEYDRSMDDTSHALSKKTTKKTFSAFSHMFQEKPQPEEAKKDSVPLPPLVKKIAAVVQPVAVTEEAEESVWFFSYKDKEDSQEDRPRRGATATQELTSKFYEAFLDEEQKVTHGSSMVLKLKENCTLRGVELKAGTVLYGQVSFMQNRILVTINVAKYRGKTRPVQLCCYDTDFLLGLFCKGVHPVIESQGNKLLGKMGEFSDSKAIQAAEKVAAEVIQGVTKTKTFKLLQGRSCYVCER